ncbi:uncharacterized protein LOC135715060 [Ochlerotatus camptorhynchus]|uniref:uncharacterized protein LOC135715060 n=1 Tax=Ochlerotatus camptorhynchus TaxID=644619 RepID=UPI0031DE0E4F
MDDTNKGGGLSLDISDDESIKSPSFEKLDSSEEMDTLEEHLDQTTSKNTGAYPKVKSLPQPPSPPSPLCPPSPPCPYVPPTPLLPPKISATPRHKAYPDDSKDTSQSTTQSNKSNQTTYRDKKSQKRYTEKQLQELLPKIKNGSLSMYHVTKYYGIPRSTLQFRLSNKCKQHGKSGRLPVLLPDEEQKICKWLNEMERKGFPITRQRLQLKIASYIKCNPRSTPFKGNVPGRHWIDAFLRRHPQFSMRTPEAVTVASARVSEDDIRRWFDTIHKYLESHDLVDILKDPSRILNGDESGFSIQPSSKRVIATKGKKNIPIIEPGNAKQNVTVMYTFAADGTVIPPHVILPYKRLSKDLIQSFPGDWGIGTSASGWMDTLNFVEYIKKVLYPTLLRNRTIFPVLYFVDGHKSHTTFEAAEVCEKLGIILVALCPNTTRILQPADVAVFRPLKNSWARVIDEMKSENPTETVTMLNFGKLLQKANTIALKQSTIANGFRTCGLFPFNPNVVDYSKCLARKHVPVEAEGSQNQATSVVNIPLPVIEEAKILIGQEKIQFLCSIPFEYMSQADRALYYILKNILSLGESTQVAENQPEADMPRPANIQGVTIIRSVQDHSTLSEDDVSENVIELYTGDDSHYTESFGADVMMDTEKENPAFLEENMSNTYSPVLLAPSSPTIACETIRASERLIDLQILESEKKKAEELKKEKAEARAKIKLEKDEAKKIKAAEREKRTKAKNELKKKSVEDKENRLNQKKKK